MYDPDHAQLHTLLSQEKEAREALTKVVDDLLTCKVQKTSFVELVEQTLLATKDYIIGVKNLTDAIRLQIPIPTDKEELAPNTRPSRE